MTEKNIKIEGEGCDPKEIVIRINLEDVFHGKQCHPEHDEGTVIYYVIKVDKEQFELKQSEMTGKQILALVNKTSEKYALFQIGKGHEPIEADQVVSFKDCGIERFKSVPKEANEGFGVAAVATPNRPDRRDIRLLEEDVVFLDSTKLRWETIRDQSGGWILIYGFSVPAGYTIADTTLALMIPPSYPTVEFDMAYFWPDLVRSDRKEILALAPQTLDGKVFQRWSRHRSAGVWRPDVDNLETHVLAVRNWLFDELQKR